MSIGAPRNSASALGRVRPTLRPESSRGWHAAGMGGRILACVVLACAWAGVHAPLAIASGPETGATKVAPSRDAAIPDARLDVAVDKAAITTMDRITLRVSLVTPVGVAATLPEIPDDVGGFSVISRKDERAHASVDARGVAAMTWARSVTLEPFLAGEYTIPALEARVGPPGSERVVTSKPIVVKVTSVVPADEEPKEAAARDVVDPPGRGFPAWMLVAGALACGLVGAGAAWRLTRRPPPTPPADAIALSRLGEIEREGSADASLAHEISIHLRAGLASRLAMPLDRLSTPEVAERLHSRPDAKDIESILGACDEVRFGGRSVGAEEIHTLARRGADAIVRAAASVGASTVSAAPSSHAHESANEGAHP